MSPSAPLIDPDNPLARVRPGLMPVNAQPGGNTVAAPALARAGAPVAASTPSAPDAGASSPTRTSAQPGPAQAELTRLQTTGSGADQVKKNPFLRGLAKVGSVAAGLAIPRFAPNIPGTEAHHQQLLARAGGQVAQEQKAQAATDESRLRNAQATEAESLPELHKTQAELAGEKLSSANSNKEADREIRRANELRQESEGKAKESSTLAQHGFKRDETGAIVPLPYEEMSESQQGVHDLKASQAELADARTALTKAQKDNVPAAAALAQKRLESAQQAHNIAMQRLGLSEKQFEMRAHGTEGGEALPGAMLNDENKPVGTAFQQNVRPTGQERNKGDMARSAAEQLKDIKGIITKRPDIFGPVAGRKTDFTVWLGSQDPDAQAFRAAETIAADHLAGTFGARSETIVRNLHDAIGRFKDNPGAALAGINQIEKAAQTFQNAGTVKSAGSNAAKAAKTVRARDPQGNLHEAPAGTKLPAGWKAE